MLLLRISADRRINGMVNVLRHEVVRPSARSAMTIRTLLNVGNIHDFKDMDSFGTFQKDFVTNFVIGQYPGQG